MKDLTDLISLIKMQQVYVDLLHFFTACKRIALMRMRKLPVNFGGTGKLK